LEDIREYSLDRHVQDLEAIREQIRADRLIFVAHAEGSEIAVRYMNAHPDRVERVVFYSPTSMWNDQDYFEANTRTAIQIIPSDAPVAIRQSVALTLGLYNPIAAENYVSQELMTIWADLFTDEGRMVCAGDRELAPDPESPGYNQYVSLIGDVTDDIRPDPRIRLGEIFVPTILLRGECDYLDWGVVQQYWNSVPNIRIYYIENAGSMLHLSQPGAVKEIILGFLNETPVPYEPLSEQAIQMALPIIDEVR
jgi:proline iminopeptidase